MPDPTAPGREIHSLLAGMSSPIRLLNVSNLSHGGSTHILPTYPAPFQKPSGVKRKGSQPLFILFLRVLLESQEEQNR